MNGIYSFYQNGKLIAAHKNLITTEGKRLILRYLAGNSPTLGGAIGLGVLGTAATVSDVRMGFEIYRAEVALRNADYASGTVLFKGTIEQEAEFTAYEAGLWSTMTSASGTFDSRLLTTFDLEVEEWTNVIADTTAERTSADSVRVDAVANATTSARLEIEMDFSGYSVDDTFVLAFNKTNNNVTTLSLVFEDLTTGGNFKLSKTVTALPVGYNVVSFRKGDFVPTGLIGWENISRFGLDVTAGATAGFVVLDGIRVEDTDTTDQDHILVSRAVLGTPLVKTNVAPMDVEYSLEFTVS